MCLHISCSCLLFLQSKLQFFLHNGRDPCPATCFHWGCCAVPVEVVAGPLACYGPAATSCWGTVLKRTDCTLVQYRPFIPSLIRSHKDKVFTISSSFGQIARLVKLSFHRSVWSSKRKSRLLCLRWYECLADLPRSMWLRRHYIEFGGGQGQRRRFR
jgi:hypothetical protein